MLFLGYGFLQWKINNLPTSPNVKLAFYDDDSQRWPDIYKKSVSCEQKLMQSNFNISANTQNTIIEPRDVRSPHFWYVAGVNCGGDIDLDYEITFLNSWGDNKWIKQFSCDEIGMYLSLRSFAKCCSGLEGLYISYFVFYIIGGLVHAFAVYSLVSAGSYHSVR